ncbi:tRNA A64-2'-O-ribosylphosphate transferase [Coemansia erecta]|uniref:tRNA A64-2'-O-ribosylphosphate transferase n=1 Tax=Coemansia erecta TaxID=147472 RepID=A0A9W7XXD6_9FUNG|nr:tRNA A64-2'-O-ribosylphosphate transferase [Coemansia erecta]
MADPESDFDDGLYKIAQQLRAESRSLYNRLRSIEADGEFVQSAASRLGAYPVLPNERCGLWYVDPLLSYAQTVYFKSTDGHNGYWRFSLRRANTHVFPVLASHGGCVIVDSTRRGKTMPDAFARTIPLWCAVWNAAMGYDATVYVPEDIVAPSERSRMQELVSGFAAQLKASAIDVADVTRGINRPLRPQWIGRESNVRIDAQNDFIPVVCLCASAVLADVRIEAELGGRPAYRYVQGAADDHETWALGLTPRLFWKHRRVLIGGSPETCEPAVQRVVSQAAEDVPDGGWFSFVRQTNVAVGGRLAGRPPECWATFDAVINCGAPEYLANAEAAGDGDTGSLRGRYLFLPIPEGKRGQAELGKAIGPALDFVRPLVCDPTKRVLVHCSQGVDRSVGIALAILTRYFSDDEKFADVAASDVSKESIQTRLLWITTSRTKANPSRATLKQVNRYFLDILVVDGTFSLGHNQNLGGAAMFDRALGVIKSEWRRFEHERADWDVERIRLKAKLAACEKRIEHLHAQHVASQRQVAILESLINAKQPVADSRQTAPAMSTSQQPSSDAVSHLVSVTSSRTQRSRGLLERCLREIDILLSPPVHLASPAIIAGTGSPPPSTAAPMAVSPALPPKSPPLSKALRRKSADAMMALSNGVIESEVASMPQPWQMPASLSRSSAAAASKTLGAGAPEPRPIRELSEKRRRRSQSSLQATEARQPSIFESQDFIGPLPPLPKPSSAPPVNSPVSNGNENSKSKPDASESVDQVQDQQVETEIDDDEDGDEDDDSARPTIDTLKVDEVDQDIDVLTVGQIDQTENMTSVDEVSYDSEWQVTKTFVGHLDTVRAVSVRQVDGSADDSDGVGTQVLSGSDDGLVILWDVDRSMRRRSRRRGAGNVGPQTIFRGHLAAVTSVAFDASHGYAYSASLDHTVNVWALPAGENASHRLGAASDDSAEMCFAQRAFSGHSDAVWGVALSARAGLLASVSADATCRVWSTDPRYASVAQRACLVANDAAAPQHTSLVPSAARFVSDDGSRLAVAYTSGHLGVHDVGGNTSKALVFEKTRGRLARITDIAWQGGAAASTVAAACADGSVHLCDLRTGSPVISLRRADGLTAAATSVDIFPASTYVVAGASDGIVSLWDWRSPQAAVREVARHQRKGDEGVCAVAAFGSQGATVASAGADGQIVFASPIGNSSSSSR